MEKINPYKSDEDKSTQVERMFDEISAGYDRLNSIFTFGIDRYWRKKTLSQIETPTDCTLLDLACGTGDLALMAAQKFFVPRVVGLDLSRKMLEIAEEKLRKIDTPYDIEFKRGRAEQLPFDDNSFDAISVGFGVRNFENLDLGLGEIYRVLKPGGKCIILETSQPKYFPIRQCYMLYTHRIMPLLIKLNSGDAKAYRYLAKSAMKFPAYENFMRLMAEQNFRQNTFKSLTLGICCIYTGIK